MRLKFFPPLMPTLVEKPPEGDHCIHEVEFGHVSRSSEAKSLAPKAPSSRARSSC